MLVVRMMGGVELEEEECVQATAARRRATHCFSLYDFVLTVRARGKEGGREGGREEGRVGSEGERKRLRKDNNICMHERVHVCINTQKQKHRHTQICCYINSINTPKIYYCIL